MKKSVWQEMSPAERKAYSDKQDRIARRVVKGLATVSAATLVASGATLVMRHDADAAHAAKLGQPDSACDIRQTAVHSGDDLERAAKDCLADRVGKIALISDENNLPYLQRQAQLAMQEISDGTNGLVRPEVVPILASPETLKKFHEANLSCVNVATDIKNSLAYIADTTMDLHEYGHIFGAMSQKRCDGVGVGNGDTDPLNGSRYMNTYEAGRLPNDEYGSYFESRGLADLIAHESGHAYGLGHAGSLELTQNGYGIFRGGFMVILSNKAEMNEPLDATSIAKMNDLEDITPPKDPISPQEYQGYGGRTNLMGRHDGKLTADAIQQWQLQWPERVLGQIQDRQQILNWTTTMIEPVKSSDHDFVTLVLGKPVTIRHTDGKNKIDENSFTKLIFDPVPNAGNRFKVYFADDDHVTIMELGDLTMASRENQTIQLKIADQLLQLKTTPGKGVEFSDLTAQQSSKAALLQQPR